MNIKLRKFQEGGVAPAAGAPTDQSQAPGQTQEQDPLAQIAQMAMQALQNKDCNAAMQVCAAFVQMLQQSQQGAEQGTGQAPEGEPVYRKGGKLVRRIK